MLATDSETPVVTQTTMGADLLQALEILAQLGLHLVSEDLRVLAIGDVALSVEEPSGDFVLGGVLDDGDDALEFFGGDFSGAVVGFGFSMLVYGYLRRNQVGGKGKYGYEGFGGVFLVELGGLGGMMGFEKRNVVPTVVRLRMVMVYRHSGLLFPSCIFVVSTQPNPASNFHIPNRHRNSHLPLKRKNPHGNRPAQFQSQSQSQSHNNSREKKEGT